MPLSQVSHCVGSTARNPTPYKLEGEVWQNCETEFPALAVVLLCSSCTGVAQRELRRPGRDWANHQAIWFLQTQAVLRPRPRGSGAPDSGSRDTSHGRAVKCRVMVLQNKLDVPRLEFDFSSFSCYHAGLSYARKVETRTRTRARPACFVIPRYD